MGHPEADGGAGPHPRLSGAGLYDNRREPTCRHRDSFADRMQSGEPKNGYASRLYWYPPFLMYLS